jgi:hypothetical protein
MGVKAFSPRTYGETSHFRHILHGKYISSTPRAFDQLIEKLIFCWEDPLTLDFWNLAEGKFLINFYKNSKKRKKSQKKC